VWDGETDKGNGTGGGNGGAGKDDGGQARKTAGEANALAEGAGDVVAHAEPVEKAGRDKRKHGARENKGTDLEGDIHGAAGERADLPEAHFVERAGAGEENRADDGLHDGSHCRSGKGQLDGRGAFAAKRGYGIDDQHGEASAGEGEPDIETELGDAEGGNADNDEKGGAGIDAENGGIGQRIARGALQDCAGEAEGNADENADYGARQAQVPDDAVFSGIWIVGNEGRPDHIDGNGTSARGHGKQHDGKERRAQEGETEAERCRTARPFIRAPRWHQGVRSALAALMAAVSSVSAAA
jgi:hypothetical protein